MNRPKLNHKAARCRGAWLLRLILLVLVAGGAVLGVRYLRARSAGAKHAQRTAGDQYYKVKRGPLLISLLAPGTVKAKTTTEIKNVVPGDVKIIWIVDEGTMVKKGDKLVELDSANLKESVTQERIENASAEAAYLSAQEELAIQESKNRADLLKAQNALDLAQLDLEKYTAPNGDYQQKLREATSSITIADAELKRATERQGWTQKLLAKNYVSKGDLEADTLDQTKQQIELEKARYDKELLEKFEYKRELSKLQTAVAEAREVLEQTRHENESELRSKKTAVDTAKAKLDLQQSQLAEKEEQLKNCIIFAPQEGMVVYPQGRGPWDDSNRIQVGSQVRNQQKLIDLPDFSAWQVETRVHESRIQQVKPGQRAVITLDAFNGAKLEAAVARIAVLPESGNWFMPDTKEYVVNLELTTTTLPLKPGMSAKTELMLDHLDNVLSVPIQAVSTVDGKTVAWVKGELGVQKREVEVGQNNDRFVEVRRGLKEGEMVKLQGDLDGGANPFGRPSDDGSPAGKDGPKKKGAGGEQPGKEKRPDAAPGTVAAADQETKRENESANDATAKDPAGEEKDQSAKKAAQRAEDEPTSPTAARHDAPAEGSRS